MRGSRSTAVVLIALATASSAAAAYVCHPDPSGTRTLRIEGQVATYAMKENSVSVLFRNAKGDCRALRWNILRGPASDEARPGACNTTPKPTRSVSRRGRVVSLIAGSADSPDRLKVQAGDRIQADWPLPARAWSLDVDQGTAVISTVGSREVYAVHLSTGRATIVAPNRHRDPAQIERTGVVFQDNLYKRNESRPTRLMKFLPRSFVEKALTRVGRALTLRGRIADIAMDGSRIGLAVDGFQGNCDAVIFWNVTWRFTSRITEEDETTCRLSRLGADIKTISMGGLRAAWTIKVGERERLLTASSVDCFERLIASAQRISAVSGDEKLLAFGLAQRDGGLLGGIDKRMRRTTLAEGIAAPTRLAADAGRLAVLLPGGVVDLRAADGRLLREFARIPDARAVALRANRLVVLTRRSLEVLDATTGRHLQTWPAPTEARGTLDVHFGVAVIPVGRQVLAISLETGRRFVAASAPAPVDAEIEAPGVAYTYSANGRGTVKFIPFARLEQALR